MLCAIALPVGIKHIKIAKRVMTASILILIDKPPFNNNTEKQI
jgi:hypothetical protein